LAQFLFRLLVGGAVVSVFAVLGDLLKPKSFAGLFGAAPSVALATLGLTVFTDGKPYAATEARSMNAGAAAFFVYACASNRLLMRHGLHAPSVTIASMVLWFAVALGIWLAFLR
jgi:hypothetical protein